MQYFCFIGSKYVSYTLSKRSSIELDITAREDRNATYITIMNDVDFTVFYSINSCVIIGRGLSQSVYFLTAKPI